MLKLKPKLIPSEREKAEAEVTRVFALVGGSLKKTFNDFWYRKDGTLRPQAEVQAMADALGDYGVNSMEHHAALQTALYTISPYHAVDNPEGWKPLVPPYQYTKNQDGTITIGDLAQ